MYGTFWEDFEKLSVKSGSNFEEIVEKIEVRF